MASSLQEVLTPVPGERLTYEGTVSLRLDKRVVEGSGSCVVVVGGTIKKLIDRLWFKHLLFPHSRGPFARISI